MKNFIFNTKFVLLVVGFIFLLLPVSAQTSWQTAIPLAKNEQKQGELSPQVNEHWYKITISQDTKARFGFKTDGILGIYYLTLYNVKDGTIKQRNAEYCRNTADTLTVNDLAAGTYYLKIDRDYNQGAYTLSYSEIPPVWADDTEPNNNFRTASKTLVPGEEVTGHLGYYYQSDASDRDTQDWYKVEITRNVKARFGFKTDGTLGIYYLTLYNAKGDTIEQRNAEYCRNMADTLTVNDLAVGIYYLKIDRDYNQGAYTLSYSETVPQWANDTEPNNAYNDIGVKTLQDKQPVTGHLGYFYKQDASDRDKEDWYKVTVAKNGAGSFEFETDKTLGVYYLRLYSFRNNVLKERNSQYCRSTSGKLMVPDLEAGTYFLKIDHDYNQGTYKLTYTAIDNPVQNDTEPNNKYNDPGVVTLLDGQPITGQLGYTLEGTSDLDKEDWYRVEINRNVKARFGFKTDGTLGVYYLTLYNLKDDTIEQRSAKYCRNTADTLTVNDLAAGTYYLKIDRDYNQGAYTLSYKEIPPVLAADAEPNNNFITASKTLVPSEEVTGHLGYYYQNDESDRDTED
ncbi:MAG TPA: hypothetical protein GXZ87_02695 [Bacteroidales bacterium]|nr:hypothetical protein [Bacteroidales bacterium]